MRGRRASLENSTCQRTLDDSGLLHEPVKVNGEHGASASDVGLSEEDLNQWIANFPIEYANRVAHEHNPTSA